MAKQVVVVLTEEDAVLLQSLLDERRSRGSSSRPSQERSLIQAPHGIVAMSPTGGIPHANASTMMIYGALCNMYKEVGVAGQPGQRTLEAILHPDATPWQEYVFHLDPADDVEENKALITFPTKWGTRYALWESCNTWGT
jgi:hypothetical protein